MNEKGQASLEYILLVAVMITLAISFFGKVNEYVIDNPDSLLNSYLGGFQNVLGSSGNGVNANYKRFNLPR
jgi:uncharacterized protein (UPF0333 family)